MRLLVIGREGQLARSLGERAGPAGAEVSILARPEIDLARPDEVGAKLAGAIDAHRPDAVINAAAYTNVDGAETEPALAEAINARSPGALGEAARGAGVPLVHVSTDYVFDGSADRPLRPDDPVAPLGIYGQTKEGGERALRAAHPDGHAIVRTAWVTSPFGRNFLLTMLRLAEERDELRVVGDQIGSPTSALDLADAVIAIARGLLAGTGGGATVHVAGGGRTSWAGLAEAVLHESRRHGGPHARVTAIPSAEYPTPARRPPWSVLDTSRAEELFGIAVPPWEEAQRAIVRRVVGAG